MHDFVKPWHSQFTAEKCCRLINFFFVKPKQFQNLATIERVGFKKIKISNNIAKYQGQ